MSKTRSSLLNLLYNYANVSFVIINGLILVPLYLTYFSVGTYGSYLSSGNIIGMLGLLEGGASFVLTQKLSNCYVKNKMTEFGRILGSGLIISLSIFSLLVLIGLIFTPFISNWVKAEPNEYRNIQYAFLLSAIGAGLNIVYHNISAVFQAMLKVNVCGLSNIVSIILGISSTLIGLKLGLGVIAIPLGALVKGLVGIIILISVLIKFHREKQIPSIQINKSIIKELLNSILPMFGGGVAKSLVTNSQLLIITNFINPTASAVFFITSRIYQVCDSFLAPVGSSIFSSISQIVGEGDKTSIKNSITRIFFAFNAFSVLILSLSFIFNASFVTLLLGTDKYGGLLLSLLLCVNMLFYTRFNFLSVNLYALGIFGKTIMYDVIGGILRLVIILVLIHHIGYISLPIAEFLSTTILLGYFLNKLIIKKLEMEGKEVIGFVFSGASLIFTMSITTIIWVNILPQINNWILFATFSLLVGTLNGTIILLFFSDIRKMIYNILKKTFLRKVYRFNP
ncbi:lipopolysaccharide biosynthesis protein [Pedobacter puniceum]|uniref:lipopolysaccharide biosynthesis protein n=1 Tax=Pedobacter puniceum TaxID=2666136 RepID=UPI0018A23626|nr:oligosaccharide flippase family protein [Pedobacter puniceum]